MLRISRYDLDRSARVVELRLVDAGHLVQELDALHVARGDVHALSVERRERTVRARPLVDRLERLEGEPIGRIERERAAVQPRGSLEIARFLVVDPPGDEGELRRRRFVDRDVRERVFVDLREARVLVEVPREPRQRVPHLLVGRVLPEEPRVRLERALEILEVVLVDLSEAPEQRLALVEAALGGQTAPRALPSRAASPSWRGRRARGSRRPRPCARPSP